MLRDQQLVPELYLASGMCGGSGGVALLDCCAEIDELTMATHLRHFIQDRQDVRQRLASQRGLQAPPSLRTCWWEDTPHVMHWRTHPERYEREVQQILDEALGPAKAREADGN